MEFEECDIITYPPYLNEDYLNKVNICTHSAVLTPTIYNVDGVIKRVNLYFKVTFTHKHDKVTVSEVEVEKNIMVRMSAIQNEAKELMLLTHAFEKMILDARDYFLKVIPIAMIDLQIPLPLIHGGEVVESAGRVFSELKKLSGGGKLWVPA